MACNLSYMRRRMQLAAQPHKAKASGAVATFRTNLAARLDSLFVDVTPVQDLHGQQYPYPAGGGKNILPTVLADIKAANTNGTWNGNQYVYRGITYTFETDSAGNVTGVKAEGTSGSSVGVVDIGTYTYPAGTYILNGCPTKYGCMLYDGTSDIQDTGAGATFTFTEATEKTFKIRIAANTKLTTAVYFYPMVRLATVTDATFAPYSNVCPITGWAAAKVSRDGVNLVEDSIPNKNISDTGKITNSSTNSLFLARVKKGVTYTFSQSGALCYAYFTDKPEDYATSYNGIRYTTGGTTVVAPIDGWIAFRGGNDFETPMIVVGDTLPAYKPYVGTTAVIQFGQTLYGARIDWNGRKAVADYALKTLYGDDVFHVAQASTGIWNARFYILPGCTFTTATTTKGNVKSNMYVSAQGAGIDYAVRLINGYPYVYNSTLDTLEKAQTFYDANPLQIWYPLAEPVGIPLDLVDFVTVPGINNVFADCGDTDLSYWTNV